MTAAVRDTSAPGVGLGHQRMFIDGEWVDTDEHYTVVNPATEDVVTTVAHGRREHADAAVAAALRVHRAGTWRDVPPNERAALFRRVADALEARTEELTVLGSRENGATRRMSGVLSVGMPVEFIRYFADLIPHYEFEQTGSLGGPMLAAAQVLREPIGVCAGIIPWNFPLPLAVWKAVPALAAGNPVVIKVDEKTPLLVLQLAQELARAGLPPGAFNVITGDGPEVGGRLAAHPDVRKVAFTGSTATGRSVMRAASDNLKGVTLELGGKGPNIVLDDADLEMAVDGSIWAFLMHSGQACESGTRLLLPASIHDEFVRRMVERLHTLRMGDPLDPATDLGPLVSAAQRDRVLDYIAGGKAAGAQLVVGGGKPTGPAFDRGYWVEPTLFTGVTNDMRIAREEIFGPVLSVLRYETVDEAVAIANDTEYGLSAGVWSRDNERALDVARRLEAGTVWINDWHSIVPHHPFGGYKQSGFGRELGPRALDEYTERKVISLDLTGRAHDRAFALVVGSPIGV